MEPLAEKLRAFIQQRFGIDATIRDTRFNFVRSSGLEILIGSGDGFGDTYSGGVDVEVIHVAVPRPDGASLKVTQTVGIHQWSGQCDLDRLEISGAQPDEIEALRAIFMPRRPRPDRDVAQLVIDGVTVDPWET